MAIWCFAAAATQAQSLIYSHFSVKDGLSSSSIYKIFQDSKGYIWLGTDLGVDRYDGLHFTNYSIENGLPDPDIIDIYEDSRGRIWFVSIKGVLSYFYNNKIYIPHFNGVSNTGFISIAEDRKGNTWLVKNSDSICVLSPDNKLIKTYIDQENLFWMIYETADGKMAGEWQYGLYQVYKDSIKFFHQRERLIKEVRIRSIPSADGNIIFSNHTGINILKGSESINLSKGKIETDKIGVLSLMLDRNSQLWIGSREGIYICDFPDFDSTPRRWLKSEIVSSILQDKEGNIWCGTQGDGLYFLPTLEHYIYTTENGLKNNNITTIDGDGKGTIWAGDKEGNIYKIRNDELKLLLMKDEGYLSATSLKSIPDGKLIGARTHQFFILDEKGKVSKYNIYVKIVNIYNDTLILCRDNTGMYLIPLDHMPGPEKIGHFAAAQNVVKIKTTSVAGDTLYFASRDKIYFLRRNGDIQEVQLPPLNFNAAITQIIAEGNNTFWISTYGAGIFRFEHGELSRYGTKEGLPSNFCKFLFKPGKSEVLWVATSKGVGRITKAGGNYKPENYTLHCGIEPTEVNAVYQDSQYLWAATINGIIRLPLQESFKSDPPGVRIEDVFVNDKAVGNAGLLKLKHSENEIRFNYIGLTYRNKRSFHYAYKLAGYDTSWHTTTGNSIQYTSLGPGDYTFLVKTVTTDGHESPLSRLHFVIRKAVWQETWFFMLVALLSLGGAAGMVLLAIRRIRNLDRKRYELKKKMNELEVRALRGQMNPHFLFNSLNSIQNYIIKQDKKQASIYLAKFASLMHMIIDNSRKSTILLEDELKFLQVYMELEKLRFENKLEYSLEIGENINRQVNIPSMVIQPFIENALKHGLLNKEEGGFIKVSFAQTGDNISCIVEDNGIGRGKAAELAEKNNLNGTGTGISATIERLRLLVQGQDMSRAFQFIDLKDDAGNAAGSMVKLLLPIINN